MSSSPLPFLVAVRRSAPAWGALAAVVGAATFWVAASWRPMPLVYAAQWLLIGLVGLPLLFVLALGSVSLVLSGLLVVLATPWLLLRRPTGLRDVLAEVWSLPAAILPRYWAALREVRQPALWGTLLGFVAAVATYVALHGWRGGVQ